MRNGRHVAPSRRRSGRWLVLLAVVMLFAVLPAGAGAAPPPPDNDKCATIQGGTITDTAGNPVSVGYDDFGYNYQAHMFNGTYDSSDRVIDGLYAGSTDYADNALIMKWSNAWLANVDCDADGKLDRGLGTDGYAGDGDPKTLDTSRGWLTNHETGDYVDEYGNVQHYTYFVKIVWTGPGSLLWREYTIIEEVLNDPAAGYTGLYSKIGAPGFGLNDQWTTN